MRITKVEYRETVTLGDHREITVGATADVLPGDSPDDCLEELRVWVCDKVGERIYEAHRWRETATGPPTEVPS